MIAHRVACHSLLLLAFGACVGTRANGFDILPASEPMPSGLAFVQDATIGDLAFRDPSGICGDRLYSVTAGAQQLGMHRSDARGFYPFVGGVRYGETFVTVIAAPPGSYQLESFEVVRREALTTTGQATYPFRRVVSFGGTPSLTPGAPNQPSGQVPRTGQLVTPESRSQSTPPPLIEVRPHALTLVGVLSCPGNWRRCTATLDRSPAAQQRVAAQLAAEIAAPTTDEAVAERERTWLPAAQRAAAQLPSEVAQ